MQNTKRPVKQSRHEKNKTDPANMIYYTMFKINNLKMETKSRE